MKSKRRRVALVALLATLAMGCGSKSQVPLPPPTPQVEGILLEWVEGRLDDEGRYAASRTYRLELEHVRRFRYSWRAVSDEAQDWRHLDGAWHRVEGKKVWRLVPDGGREALKPGAFAEDEWPELKWLNTMTPGLTPQGPALGAMYLIPVLDPTTARLEDSFVLQSDPRALARSEALGNDQ